MLPPPAYPLALQEGAQEAAEQAGATLKQAPGKLAEGAARLGSEQPRDPATPPATASGAVRAWARQHGGEGGELQIDKSWLKEQVPEGR